jgi:putative MFS transporter
MTMTGATAAAAPRGTGTAVTGGLINARMERLPYTSLHVRARLIVGTATFFDAFDILSLTTALTVLIGMWHLKPQEIGYLISAGFAGQLIGAIGFGWLAERFGRIPTLTVMVALFGVMSLACAFAWSYNALLVMRVIQGIGLGGEVPVAAAYINEMSKARGRGRFFLLYELVFGVGLVAATLVSIWAVPHFGWQSMFVIGAVPALLVPFFGRYLPESPRWLAARGRLEEADRGVRAIEDLALREGHALAPIDPATIAAPKQIERRVSELFKGRYLPRTLMVWVIWFCTFFVSYGITVWMPALYRTVFHLSVTQALTYALGITLAGLVGNFVCAFVIDKLGRRVWFALTFCLGALPLALLWYLGVSSAVQLLVLASISYFLLGPNSIATYLYTPEIYPTRLRALGTGIASAWLRVASFVGPIIVGYLLAGGGIAAVFGTFALVSLVGGVVSWFFAVETTGQVLDEISP